MILLIPLTVTTLIARVFAGWLARRGVHTAKRWASWSAALAIGMAVVYLATATTHFTEPQRSGLRAIIPSFLPAPDAIVTLSGVAEFALAAGLVIPRTRRVAAIASAIFLIAVFPANVVAASGVDHPAAPSTPLLLRTSLQIVFVACSLAVFFSQGRARRSANI